MTQLVERMAGAPVAATCRNRIEEDIIRAYARLAYTPDQANGRGHKLLRRLVLLKSV